MSTEVSWPLQKPEWMRQMTRGFDENKKKNENGVPYMVGHPWTEIPAADKNGDGRLNSAEYNQAASDLFDHRFDGNRDGQVSKAEWLGTLLETERLASGLMESQKTETEKQPPPPKTPDDQRQSSWLSTNWWILVVVGVVIVAVILGFLAFWAHRRINANRHHS